MAKARKVGVSDRGGSDIKKEAQGGRINDRNGSEAAVVGKVTGKVEVPEEMWDNVSAHGFLKRGTTSMFDVLIIN